MRKRTVWHQMTRPCTVCGHKRRAEIDAALLDNVRYETISTRFQTSLTSVLAHRSHLDRVGASSAEQTTGEQTRGIEQESVGSLLDQMHALYEKSVELLHTVESTGEPRAISIALLQVRRNLRALGDLTEHVRESVRAVIDAPSSDRSV